MSGVWPDQTSQASQAAQYSRARTGRSLSNCTTPHHTVTTLCLHWGNNITSTVILHPVDKIVTLPLTAPLDQTGRVRGPISFSMFACVSCMFSAAERCLSLAVCSTSLLATFQLGPDVEWKWLKLFPTEENKRQTECQIPELVPDCSELHEMVQSVAVDGHYGVWPLSEEKVEISINFLKSQTGYWWQLQFWTRTTHVSRQSST